MSRPPTCTIFVGNLPFDITESALTELLSSAGPVKNLRLVNDRETGRFKGFGFCEFYDVATAESAHRNLNNQEIQGRQIRIDYAEDFESKSRGFRGDGGGGLGGQGGAIPSSSKPPISSSAGPAGPGASIGYAAAAVSASQVAALIGGPPSSDRDTQERLNKVFASYTRSQLWEVMREIKATVCHDKGYARHFFKERPGLAKALFQAQVLLGMVKPPAAPPPEPQAPPPAAGYPAADAAAVAAAGGYGRRNFGGPASFQEGPMGLGGRSQLPGAMPMGQPPPPPPPRGGGPMALQPPPPPRPMNPAGPPPQMVQHPMQVLMTQDGQQVMQVMPAPQVGLQPQGVVQMPGPGQQPAAAPQPPPLQMPPQPPPAGGGPGPGSADLGGAAAGGDQTAVLLRQVLSMSDEQINALPPEYRTQVLFVKEQIRIGAIKVD